MEIPPTGEPREDARAGDARIGEARSPVICDPRVETLVITRAGEDVARDECCCRSGIERSGCGRICDGCAGERY